MVSRNLQVLMENEAWFRQFTDNADIVFWVCEPDVSKFHYISPGYEKIWGRTCEELYSNPQSFLDAVHAEDLERVKVSAMGQNACNMSEEYRIVRDDGTVRWIRDRTFPVHDKNGKVTKMVGFAYDITMSKQAEKVRYQVYRERVMAQIIQAIRSSLDLETIFNIAVNEIGKLLQVDHVKISEFISEEKGWLTVAHYRSHSDLPMSVGTYVPDRGNVGTQKLKRLEIFRIDNTNNCEDEVTRQIAQTFPGAWLILPLHFNGVVWGSLCLLIDGRPHYWQKEEIELITIIADQLAIAIQNSQLYQQVQQLAEQEIYKALQRQRELSEAKSQFIATTCHETRTPLATIQSSLDMLQYCSDKLTAEKRQQHFYKIETAIKQITRILQDTLLISESEAGTLGFETTLVDVERLCQEIMETIVDNQNRIEFTNSGGEIYAQLDAQLIRYLLNNLLENALKYSSSNAIVKFDLDSTSTHIVLRIQDQGIGIPEENLSRIFDTFYRASNVTNIPGTGLGLAIVKECVDLHEGEILVDSVVGKGTVFTIKLPKNL